MSQTVRDDVHYTYGQYLGWPEDQRYELIDGMAYAMSPAPTRVHQEVVVELLRQISSQLVGKPCRVYVAPFDVRLPKGNEANEAIDTVVQPDIAVICDRQKLDDRGCRGAPDWIIEIISPASVAHDQIRKLALYERHGVREYWLVHPIDRIVAMYRWANGAYGRPEMAEFEGRSICAAVPEAEIDWARLAELG